MGKVYYVDIPYPDAEDGDAWVNRGKFPSRESAQKFLLAK